MPTRYGWVGTPPKRCDICMRPKPKVFVDGKTKKGHWAWMCPVCHDKFGVGLGLGKGKEYKIETT